MILTVILSAITTVKTASDFSCDYIAILQSSMQRRDRIARDVIKYVKVPLRVSRGVNLIKLVQV